MRLLRIGSGIAIALVACCAQILAQSQPKPSAKPPGKGDSVVVRGCLSGPTLQSLETTTVDRTGSLSTPLTYQLKGDKGVLKPMREQHDGQVVVVTGVLKSDLPDDSAARGTTVGKTKITFGLGSPSGQKGPPTPHASLPVLEIKSYDGSGARCKG